MATYGSKSKVLGHLRWLRAIVVLVLVTVSLPLVHGFAAARAGEITTVAGTGSAGYTGDGGAATSAQLNAPAGVAFDSAGNVYIADTANSRVRKIDATGAISTVAGIGTPGYSGDGGSATSAKLQYPTGLAFYSAGNLYIGDTYNHRVRKVNAAGIISTFAGNGTLGDTGDGGPATSAELHYPEGLVFDSAGTLYVANQGSGHVRKVNVSGTISSAAGTGTQGYSGDGGPATSAKLYDPEGLGIDAAGNLYIADAGNNRVREVDTAGLISTVAGTGAAGSSGDGGPATLAQLDHPRGLTLDRAGNLYIADTLNHNVRRVDARGIISKVAGTGSAGYSGDGGPATSAQLNTLEAVSTDSAGNLLIADTYNNVVRRVDEPSASSTATVTVDPAAQARTTGQTATLTATARDAGGDPVIGATVTFSRSGANGTPSAVSAVTDASGHATYSYVGTNAGDDSIQASSPGDLSGTAVVHWTAQSLTYPSDDCDASGSNVVTGFVDGAYVKAKTSPGGANSTWVCLAAEAGGTHVGGKVTLNASVPGISAAGVDLDDASVAACAGNANNIRIDSGTILGQPWWVDVTPSPIGSTDSAWVCIRLTGSVGVRLRLAPGVSVGLPTFSPDTVGAHVPPYTENPWPAPGQPSAACQNAGGIRLANLTVGNTPIALYAWQEALTKADVCVREGATGGVGARATVNALPTITGISTTNSTSPCPLAVFTSSNPSFGIFTSNPGGLPVSACVAVGGTALGVSINTPSVGSAVTIQPDTA